MSALGMLAAVATWAAVAYVLVTTYRDRYQP